MGNEHGPDATPDLLAIIDAALEELEQRNRGEFNGVTGKLPDNTSVALMDVTYYLRDFMLEKYPEDKVRRMLAAQYVEGMEWVPSSTDADDLALGLLGLIASACRAKERDHLLSGRMGSVHLNALRKGRLTQQQERVQTELQIRILKLAKEDKGPARGKAVRIHNRVINSCSYEYVRKTLKKLHN